MVALGWLAKAASGCGFFRGGLIECQSRRPLDAAELALGNLAAFRREGRPVALVELDHSFAESVALARLVRDGGFYLAQPTELGEALALCERLLGSRQFGAVVLDFAATLAESESRPGFSGRDVLAVRRFARIAGRSATPCLITGLSADRPGVFFETDGASSCTRILRRAVRRTIKESA